MGFNTYNTFGRRSINQAEIAGIVRAMAADGMRASGYQYVILDDGWQGTRTSSGQITANPALFPCGIKQLAAFVHAEGLLFGIYTSPAPQACSGRVGSGGHVIDDARTFASWGVDYVKLDWCGADYSPSGAAAIARTWRAALNATGRPMILSINAGGSPSVGPWARAIANSWRVGGDICGSWYNQTRPPSATARACYNRKYDEGIYDYLASPGVRAQVKLAGPGHYIDPDMLEVGTAAESADGQSVAGYALTPAEAGTNFAMWAMWSAPLIAGNDPRTMTGTDLASQILLNRQIIAVDQDPLGRPATLVLSHGSWQVWHKTLSGGRVAVAVVNLADAAEAVGFSWAELGLAGPPHVLSDVWTHRDVLVADAGLNLQAAAHATAMYVLSSRLT
jgi:alpha-galactosidase